MGPSLSFACSDMFDERTNAALRFWRHLQVVVLTTPGLICRLVDRSADQLSLVVDPSFFSLRFCVIYLPDLGFPGAHGCPFESYRVSID